MPPPTLFPPNVVMSLAVLVGLGGCAGDGSRGNPPVAPSRSVAPVVSFAAHKTGTSTDMGSGSVQSAGGVVRSVAPGKSAIASNPVAGFGELVHSPVNSRTQATSGPVSEAAVTNEVAWINERGDMPAGGNPFGVGGPRPTFGDGVTATASDDPYGEGIHCISGEAPGEEDFEAHWGAGLELHPNGANGGKLPFELAGRNTLVDDHHELLATLQGKRNGLVPDWSDPVVNVPSRAYGEYGADASRTPWRAATDYVWYRDQRAVSYLDNVAAYVESNGGIAQNQTPNSNYRGALGMSALQKDATTAQEYTGAWLTTSVDDESYFPGTLRLVYMLLLTNPFPKSCAQWAQDDHQARRPSSSTIHRTNGTGLRPTTRATHMSRSTIPAQGAHNKVTS